MISISKYSIARATITALAVLFFLGAINANIANATMSDGGDGADEADELKRGQYIFDLAGCAGCHTIKKSSNGFLAGGRKFETEFGTFFSPNITSDVNAGIGNWTFDNFAHAVRDGISPNGENYYPAFPYTSYRKMSDGDLKALWAYIKTIPANNKQNIAHKLEAPFGWRFLISIWKIPNFDKSPLMPVEGKSKTWDRGRYIIEALSHCRECHTPRNIMGGLAMAMDYAGTNSNPEGIVVPNITSDKETGIGKWSLGDIDMLLKMGMLPDADFVGGVMAESITHSTSKMTNDDRAAVIEYLRGVKPINNSIKRKNRADSGESWQ